MFEIMVYKIKSFFTNIAVILGIILIVIFAFRLLAYAIPVIFIIWLIKWAIGKIKGMVHEKEHIINRSSSPNKNIHIEKEKETFDNFNLNNSKVVDVEFEEVNRR
jgi:hypothetical protein